MSTDGAQFERSAPSSFFAIKFGPEQRVDLWSCSTRCSPASGSAASVSFGLREDLQQLSWSEVSPLTIESQRAALIRRQGCAMAAAEWFESVSATPTIVDRFEVSMLIGIVHSRHHHQGMHRH